MIESAFLFVGRIAFAWTVLTVAGAVYASRDMSETGDALATVGGVVGFVLWGVWSYATLNVQVVGDAVVYEFSHPELTILGIAMAMVPGYIALTGPIELINRYREPTTEQI